MFKVEYFSSFKGDWLEYVAPAWGAAAIRHETEQEARARMARLQHDHPRDTFRIAQA